MATMKTLNGYGFDSAKLGGKAPEYYIQPRNLLRNANFREPVNQRGIAYGGNPNSGYTIDSWYYQQSAGAGDGYFGLTEYYVSLKAPSDGYSQMHQNLERYSAMKGKTYTFATSMQYGNNAESVKAVTFTMGAIDTGLTLTEDGNVKLYSVDGMNVLIRVTGQDEYKFIWAALYEGTYTADNVPPPFFYTQRLEMLNLGLPMQPRNLLDNSDFRNPVNQRGQTDYTSNGYTIDRWELYFGAVGVSSLGCITTSGQMYQKIAIPTDKVYTFAIENDAGIALVTGIPANGIHSATLGNALIKLATIDGYVEVVIEPSEGHNLAGAYWAALYEGTYTADTLPPYVPKGYAAELAECQRYFRKSAQAVTIGTQYGSGSLFSLSVPEMRIKPTTTLTEIQSQGWGNVVASNYTAGWTGNIGSSFFVNYISSVSDDVGKTVTVFYEMSADL